MVGYKKGLFSVIFYCFAMLAMGQESYPVNGIADKRNGCYAFINATIIQNAQMTLRSAVLLTRKGKIIAVGTRVSIPPDAIVIDCKGKYIYPSFIDIYSDYGIQVPPRPVPTGFFGAAQITSNTKGAFGWNQAIRSEMNAEDLFSADESKAKGLREAGFGSVLTHLKDGIAQGTGAVVTLASSKENLLIIKKRASSHFSFTRGSSAQSYPQSLMGSIALLRQSFLDGKWYKNRPPEEGLNLSLEAWNNNLMLPQVFEANDKWNDLRADRIGDEFGIQYILKAGGNEYQRIPEMVTTKASFILPLNFPQAMDVEDPNDARFIALSELKHWEMAPTNPAAFEKAGINFCLTMADLKESKQFLPNLRKAIEYGLSESKALEALTSIPAKLSNVYDQVGSIEAGKWANFLVCNGPVFGEKTLILQNWVQGEKYSIREDEAKIPPGTYALVINTATGAQNYTLQIKNNRSATLTGKDTLDVKFRSESELVNISFSPVPSTGRKQPVAVEVKNADTSRPDITVADSLQKRDSLIISQTPDDRQPEKSANKNFPARKQTGNGIPIPSIRLSGVSYGTIMQGNGVDTSGNGLTWIATFLNVTDSKPDSITKKELQVTARLTYPNEAYGWLDMPTQETVLFKNATVWTSEKEGILANTDVLVQKGKISAVGRNLEGKNTRIIDATGKYLTPGIIDEHSHIAAASINEGGQSVSSEVRIGDNLDPDDINIYRQLSGGVTTAHILHGSANAIGGQTQLIKLR